MRVPMVEVRQPGRRPLHLVVVDILEVGRECDGLLIDDGEASRRHVELRSEHGRLWARDLGSTNGTTLNGAKIAGEVEIRAGDVLVVGATDLRLWEATDGEANRRDVGATISPGDDVPSVQAAPALGGDRVTSIERIASTVDGRSAEVADLRGDGNTVTVVFSDIEGSTQQALRLGDQRWFDVLGVHNEIVRTRRARFGGSEIKAQGDGFMMTFPSARRAVRFAMTVQRELAEHDWDDDERIRVRIGMHTGEAIVDDDGDLFGKHIIVAARVAGTAEGGEILVSSVVREIVSSREDIAFGPPRQVALKGIADNYQVHPVNWQQQEP